MLKRVHCALSEVMFTSRSEKDECVCVCVCVCVCGTPIELAFNSPQWYYSFQVILVSFPVLHADMIIAVSVYLPKVTNIRKNLIRIQLGAFSIKDLKDKRNSHCVSYWMVLNEKEKQQELYQTNKIKKFPNSDRTKVKRYENDCVDAILSLCFQWNENANFWKRIRVDGALVLGNDWKRYQPSTAHV